jgi:hypothetical protein
MGRLCVRGKYLRIKRDTYELPYGILTFLSEKSRRAGLRKKKNRDEKKLKASDEILIF